jgi:5-methylcytosine-specific restriction endonuclease McrA
MDTAREFTNSLADLLRSERNTLTDFIVALAEFDQRELWKDLGYPSLYPFLTRELGLSDGLAYFRMKACRLVRDFPEVVEPLRDGRLCVTNVVELSKVITPENRHEVLPRYFHVSKKEAESITVSLLPKAIVPTRSVVTAVSVPAPELTVSTNVKPQEGPSSWHRPLQPVVAQTSQAPVVARESASPRPRAEVEPLTKELARLHLTVPPRLLEKLAAARDALSHVKPGATDAEVIEAALDALNEKAAKRKGLTDRPPKTPRAATGDAIPAHVKREVWARDHGCCQWKLASGGICSSTRQVEFDHVLARAHGGPPTVENVRLLCRSHNLQAARQTFGDSWMDQFRGKRTGRA